MPTYTTMPRPALTVLTTAAAVLAAATVAHHVRHANRLLDPATGHPVPTRQRHDEPTVVEAGEAAIAQTRPMPATGARCGKPKRDGQPCMRPTATPPCATHRD